MLRVGFDPTDCGADKFSSQPSRQPPIAVSWPNTSITGGSLPLRYRSRDAIPKVGLLLRAELRCYVRRHCSQSQAISVIGTGGSLPPICPVPAPRIRFRCSFPSMTFVRVWRNLRPGHSRRPLGPALKGSSHSKSAREKCRYHHISNPIASATVACNRRTASSHCRTLGSCGDDTP